MSAVDYARQVSADVWRREPDQLERHVVAADAEYAGRIRDIEKSYAERIRRLRPRLLDELRSDDPVAAADAAPSVRRTLGLLGAALAAAGGYAFFFSRADFDLDAITPVAMVFVVAAAVLYAVACLPLRRSAPPPPNVVVGGWILVLLLGAAVGFAAYAMATQAISAWPVIAGGVVAWVGVVVLVVRAMSVRSGITPSQRTASDERASRFREDLKSAVRTDRDAAADEVRRAFEELGAGRRTALRTDARTAATTLRDRGFAVGDVPDPPGIGFVTKTITVLSTGIGVRDLEDFPVGDG